jgi:hypothetical protein
VKDNRVKVFRLVPGMIKTLEDVINVFIVAGLEVQVASKNLEDVVNETKLFEMICSNCGITLGVKDIESDSPFCEDCVKRIRSERFIKKLKR